MIIFMQRLCLEVNYEGKFLLQISPKSNYRWFSMKEGIYHNGVPIDVS